VADHVRKVKRRGKTRLVIDIPYKGPDGQRRRWPKLHSTKRTIATALTREQSIAVVEGASPHGLGRALVISTGLRPCEIRRLVWRDVDLARDQLGAAWAVAPEATDVVTMGETRATEER
jgi:integrase